MSSSKNHGIVFACNSMEGENVAHSQSVSQSVALRAIDLCPGSFLKSKSHSLCSSFCFFLFTFFIFSFFSVPPCLCESPSSSKPDSDSSKLFGFQEKLESRIFSEKDLKKCRKLLKKTKDEGLRGNLSIVLSRYERELNDRPLASLEYIAPEVLAPEMAQAFLSAVQKKQIKSGAGACQCPINILTNPSMTIPVSPVSPATDVL